MNAVRFPNMFSTNKAAIVKDRQATLQNLRTLILSSKRTLFGDPYFGTNLHKLIFESNNRILQDLVIDEIYSAISLYMPQIKVLRKNISVTSDRNNVTVNIKAQNLLDYSFDEYDINLLTVEEM